MYGDFDNLLQPTSAVFNIGLTKLHAALNYYSTQPHDHETLLALYEAGKVNVNNNSSVRSGASTDLGASSLR